MQSVGQILAQHRQALSQTLEQVSSRTRISVKNLRAIEADDLNGIGSAFFYKSFVKQFAHDLGLDYSSLEPALLAVVETMPKPRIPGEDVTAAPKVPALRLGRAHKTKMIYSISSFAVALVACSAIYAGWQSSRFSFSARWKVVAGSWHHRTESTTLTGHTQTPRASQPVGDHGSESMASISDQPSWDADNTGRRSDEAQKLDDGYKIVISATEPAWLSIITDGKQSFKGILERMETKVLEGHENARLRTGNAGAVSVVFNGRQIGALGLRGQVRTVVFTKSDYEVLDPPSHVAWTHLTETAAWAQLFRPPAPSLLF